MKDFKIRLLKADEIECRVGTTIKQKADEIECRVGTTIKQNDVIIAVTLLLYKDARCDMNILDETFGAFNWQRVHNFKDGKNYCTVSIYDDDKSAWVSKEDVGVESNTEQEKGQASDSFKRACFNWGIGRELYTAPFIYIKVGNDDLRGDKIATRFVVSELGYDDNRRINKLVIVDNNGVVRYSFGSSKRAEVKQVAMVTLEQVRMLKDLNVNVENVLKKFKIAKLEDLTYEQANFVIETKRKAILGGQA